MAEHEEGFVLTTVDSIINSVRRTVGAKAMDLTAPVVNWARNSGLPAAPRSLALRIDAPSGHHHARSSFGLHLRVGRNGSQAKTTRRRRVGRGFADRQGSDGSG